MATIINFIIRYKNALLFVFLFFVSLALTIQTHSYQKSKFISSANFLSGGLYAWMNDIDAYFNLKEYNNRLINENRELRQQLLGFSGVKNDSISPEVRGYEGDYTVYKAKVIANHYSGLDNYILIDRGKKDSIYEEYGVITNKGIVGVVENTSANYGRVISILNTKLAINAQLKNSEHFGTLSWDGGNPNEMVLTDVPKLAIVKKGDTIITNGRSFIFPKGIPIGTVRSIEMDEGEDYYLLSVQLFNDMTNIGNVYIIRNNFKPEIESLIEDAEE